MSWRTPSLAAVTACATWLRTALRLGYKREDLDALEQLWWKYHDDQGKLQRADDVPESTT